MQETSMPLGAIESVDIYNYGVQKDGCLGNTVASMVSEITGVEYNLPNIYFAWRGMLIKDELRTFARHVRKDPEKSREQRELALHRLDQRVFKMVLKSIQTTGIALDSAIPIAAVLEDSDIEYRKGGFQEILEAVNNGYQIAVMYKASQDEETVGESWWHMAHIGISKAGEIVRLSDGNASISDSTIEAINNSAEYLNSQARTWNFVAIKRKL